MTVHFEESNVYQNALFNYNKIKLVRIIELYTTEISFSLLKFWETQFFFTL